VCELDKLVVVLRQHPAQEAVRILSEQHRRSVGRHGRLHAQLRQIAFAALRRFRHDLARLADLEGIAGRLRETLEQEITNPGRLAARRTATRRPFRNGRIPDAAVEVDGLESYVSQLDLFTRNEPFHRNPRISTTLTIM
jgi:hypothetical protein